MFAKEHNIQCLSDISFEEPTPAAVGKLETKRMRGCGVVASWAVMTVDFVCGLCGSSDAVMASVLCHQAQRHVAPGGRHTGPYHRPAGASVGRMRKGSGIKYVVHTLPSGLQRGRTVVSWAVTLVRTSSVPAHPTLDQAGLVHSAAGAGAHSAMEDVGVENTWQEDMALQHHVL